MLPMNLSDIDILNIHGADCRCSFSGSSKIEVIKSMPKNNLTEKSGAL